MRSLFIILFSWFLLVLESIIYYHYDFALLKCELLLPIVIYMGLNMRFSSAFTVFFIGLLADLFSPVYIGLNCLIFVVIFISLFLVTEYLEKSNFTFSILTAFITFIYLVLWLILIPLFRNQDSWWLLAEFLLLNPIITALAGLLLLPLVKKILPASPGNRNRRIGISY